MLSNTPFERNRRPRRGLERDLEGGNLSFLRHTNEAPIRANLDLPSRGVEPRTPHFQYGAFPLSYNGSCHGFTQESNLRRRAERKTRAFALGAKGGVRGLGPLSRAW